MCTVCLRWKVRSLPAIISAARRRTRCARRLRSPAPNLADSLSDTVSKLAAWRSIYTGMSSTASQCNCLPQAPTGTSAAQMLKQAGSAYPNALHFRSETGNTCYPLRHHVIHLHIGVQLSDSSKSCYIGSENRFSAARNVIYCAGFKQPAGHGIDGCHQGLEHLTMCLGLRCVRLRFVHPVRRFYTLLTSGDKHVFSHFTVEVH